MYRVLIVDDEVLDLNGLEKLIPWEQLDMQVVFAVNDPFEALEYLSQQSVDILVSDIKMPIMSGIELVRKALELDPQLKVIFVSGYEDFQYAKQAIQLSAHGYVLKPIDDDEFLNVLKSVREALDLENKMKIELKHTVSQAYDSLLHKWLEGDGGLVGALRVAKEAEISIHNSPLQIAILEIDDVYRDKDLTDSERQSLVQKAIIAILAKSEQEKLSLKCRTDLNRVALILQGNERKEKLERLIFYVGENSPFTVTAGLGSEVVMYEELPQSYAVALKVLSYKIFCGKNRMITKEDTTNFHMQDADKLDEILEKMFIATTNYNLVEIDDCLVQLYLIVKGLGKKMSVYNATLHIIMKLDSFLSTINENLKDMLGIEVRSMDILYDFETVEDIQAWLRRRLFEISEMLHMKKMRKNRKLIEEIEQYVDEHLCNNITLRDVANFFAFSPNYLGYLFKEATEENFSDYVIRNRMERAMQLLKDPKLKIYEVAHQVGYNNLTYFSRQFKDQYGTSPSDYRKQS